MIISLKQLFSKAFIKKKEKMVPLDPHKNSSEV